MITKIFPKNILQLNKKLYPFKMNMVHLLKLKKKIKNIFIYILMKIKKKQKNKIKKKR